MEQLHFMSMVFWCSISVKANFYSFQVNDLKEQLNEAGRLKLVQSPGAFTSSGLNLQRVTTPSFHDEKHKHLLRKMEKNKKETYEVQYILYSIYIYIGIAIIFYN